MPIAFLFYSLAQAQNWVIMPPYNLLWPLCSPTLSPINSVTGLPTPLGSSLTSPTALLVHPVLVWDLSEKKTWLVYNQPEGLLYFDMIYGFDRFNSSDAAGDPEGDGLSNADEYTNGTYPNDTASDDEGFKDVRK